MDRLPIELVQIILGHLDPFAFHNALAACRLFRNAGDDLGLTRKHLNRLPLTPRSRNQLYGYGLASLARAQVRLSSELLLGAHVTKSGGDAGLNEHNQALNGKTAFSKDRSRAVTLRDRLLTLYSLRSADGRDELRIVSRRLLNGIRNPTKDGPVLRRASDDVFELALGDNSDIVAVALDRSVQLYDMAHPDEPPAASYLAAAGGHFIAGIDFACEDSALRVRLSKEGAVLYLGSQQSPGTFANWKQECGLRNVFLDSRNVAFTGDPETGVANPQLLDKTDSGWRFAAQQRPTSGDQDAEDFESAYCVGYLSGEATDGPERTAARPEAHLDLRLACSSAETMSSDAHYWSRQPCGSLDSTPAFCVSPDGRILIVAEQCGRGEELEISFFAWSFSATIADNHDEHADIAAGRVPIYLGSMKGMMHAFSCTGHRKLRISALKGDMTYEHFDLSFH